MTKKMTQTKSRHADAGAAEKGVVKMNIPQLPTENKLLTAALEYARFGWSVIPLAPGDKKPLVKWEKYQKVRATAAQITAFWTKNPNSNIGVVCGAISGIIVLDVDPRNGGDITLRDLEAKHGKLPDTVEQLTGGGGRHIFFTCPVGGLKGATIGAGLDLKAEGGYIVVAPSIHPSGAPYAWELSSIPGEVAIAAPPDYVLKSIAPMGEVAKAGDNRVTPADWEGDIPEGERNNTLARLAGSLLAKGNIPAGQVVEMVQAVNLQKCKPPLGREEVEGIVSSVAQTHKRKKAKQKKTEWAAAKQQKAWTDYGNAERLVFSHGQNIKYCWPWGKWLAWTGRQWREDDTAEVMRRAKKTVRNMYSEASQIEDDNERENFLKFALKSEQKERLKATMELAASEEGIPVLPVELDANPWLLNCGNGTLDLKTGSFKPHQRQDMLTKIILVRYDPDAKCPRWLQFLHEIMDGNGSLVRFLQKAAGMSLTGDVSEHMLFVLYGSGRNGKSTFLNTLLAMVGDYGMTAPPDVLMAKQNDRHPTELADLFGKRFVTTIESGEGRRLNEPLIKQLTGGDPIKARRMREDFWQFYPTHKLWLATNHKPVVRGTDLAIWSRIKLIPFNAKFPDSDPRQDKQLPEKLREELPGILAWAVEGCLAWQREGLGIPDEVRAATEGYRQEQDILAAFLAECCLINPLAKATARELYKTYTDWCETNGERSIAQRNFGMSLSERGFERDRGKGNIHIWRGLGLLTERYHKTHEKEEDIY